jgi:hypothetical protein
MYILDMPPLLSLFRTKGPINLYVGFRMFSDSQKWQKSYPELYGL